MRSSVYFALRQIGAIVQSVLYYFAERSTVLHSAPLLPLPIMGVDRPFGLQQNPSLLIGLIRRLHIRRFIPQIPDLARRPNSDPASKAAERCFKHLWSRDIPDESE